MGKVVEENRPENLLIAIIRIIRNICAIPFKKMLTSLS